MSVSTYLESKQAEYDNTNRSVHKPSASSHWTATTSSSTCSNDVYSFNLQFLIRICFERMRYQANASYYIIIKVGTRLTSATSSSSPSSTSSSPATPTASYRKKEHQQHMRVMKYYIYDCKADTQ